MMTNEKITEKLVILKVRDNREPIKLHPINEGREAFEIDSSSRCSWGNQDRKIGSDELRSRIEPWLTALFQSEHLSLLVGTGLTYAVRSFTKKDLPVVPAPEFTVYNEGIDDATKSYNQNSIAKLEMQLSVANEILAGCKHLVKHKSDADTLKKEINEYLKSFSAFVLNLESDLAISGRQEQATFDEQERAFNHLVSFLTSFASRSGTRDRLQIFTTNYDRVIEIGAEIAGLHLLDRFVGNLSPIFRSSRLNIDMHYNPPGIRGEPRYLEGVAHFTKLHGSVDWIYAHKNVRRIGLPFGVDTVESHLKAHGIAENIFNQLMIYPNAAKDKETTAYPYVELFRDFSAALCRPNSSLVTYGYGFGDDHINRVIKDMLTIPSTHLVIISLDDPQDRIMKFYESIGRPAQISLLVGKIFGNLESLVTHYLPKPAIDRITFRMADLLKNRLTETQNKMGDDDMSAKE